jgi:hypothetical protein
MATEYRTYAIRPDDHIVSRHDLICVDDDHAKERARQADKPERFKEPAPKKTKKIS